MIIPRNQVKSLNQKSSHSFVYRYRSFAPQRQNAQVKWYVDGKDYFADVADAIMSAKEEIFITDWWLSPELILKRSTQDHSGYRLDQLLKQKADEGVKVYVIVYKEIEITLYTNSTHTKRVRKYDLDAMGHL